MTTTTTEIDELKAKHRATWDSGDYAAVARDLVSEVADVAVAAADPRPGEKVLDVATGSGNAAIPAAHAGAEVTGLDLAPTLLDVARDRAESAGVDVEWVEGDAEALPYDDGSYDTVLSVIGVQFAPQHQVAANEIARVTRAGGKIVLSSWTPRGFIGQFFKTMSPHMPKPPAGASPPPLWGDGDHLRGLFEGSGVEFDLETHSVVFENDSPAGFIDYMTENYGPLLKARELLEPRGDWEALRGDLVALAERSNLAADSFLTQSEYLLARGRKG